MTLPRAVKEQHKLTFAAVVGLSIGVVGCFASSVGMDDDASTALPRSDAGPRATDGSQPDAGADPYCGDGVCDAGETAVGCPADCFVPGASPAVTAGGYHSCARTGAGTAWCWGYNRFGQLGDTTFDNANQPREVQGLVDVADLAAGQQHSCALITDGTVWCWGRNTNGQLGDALPEDATASPQRVGGLTDVVAISAGGKHTCAVRADHSAWCWGANAFGQLGDGSLDPKAAPVRVVDLPDVAAVSTGGQHSCALQESGKVWCWGRNDSGQLGDGAFESAQLAGLVATLPAAMRLTTGTAHTCALLGDGTARCWGDNTSHQLGLPGVDSHQLPTPLGALRGGALAAGDDQSCLVDTHDLVWCHGAVGIGPTLSAVAVAVPGFAGVQHLALGVDHGCGVVASGGLYCWGRNELGQLGDGTNTESETPVRVSGF